MEQNELKREISFEAISFEAISSEIPQPAEAQNFKHHNKSENVKFEGTSNVVCILERTCRDSLQGQL